MDDLSRRPARIALTPALADRIAREIAALADRPVGHVNYEGRLYNGLPIMGTIGDVWLLRADGTLWSVDSDWVHSLEPLPERFRAVALVAAAERHPWLRELIPDRPVTALDCDVCKGTGHLGSEQKAFCHPCGALGWRDG